VIPAQALEDLYVHYDATVRNAAGGIVQFAYGDDGLDPVVMEGKDGKPLDFERLLAKVRSAAAAAAVATWHGCVGNCTRAH
jgi:DNA-directed RNA polymerase III subunit RPC1